MPAPTTNTKVHLIASVCHEANRAYCKAIGDDSQETWEYAPLWQRQSAVEGVQSILVGKVKTPEEAHQAWAQSKLDSGWTYGKTKDANAKTHPCLVPYDQLPTEQKRKDALFFAIVDALL